MGRTEVDLRFRRWRTQPEWERHRSLWLRQALDQHGRPHEQTLESAIDADVCIVGGGFTGLWTALRLREIDPSVRVALLEADICGAGASGRNSGAIGQLWGKLPSLVKVLGAEDGKTLLFENLKSADDIKAACEKYGIECHIQDGDAVWLATAPAQIGSWNEVLGFAEMLGIETPYTPMAMDEIRDRFGHAPIYGALKTAGRRRLQPALLARGLRRAIIEFGVSVFERTPVERIVGSAGGKLKVVTPTGSVHAEKVVLAANAWMAHLDEFRPWVMVVSSDIVVTEPIPDLLRERGLMDRPGGINSRMMINYGGYTSDGRVYLGRGGGSLAFNARISSKFDYSARQAAEVQEDFRYLFPELADVPLAHAWAGPVDRSPAGLPRFGTLKGDDRIHYAIGFTGHGVSSTAEAGHVLASAVLGHENHWSALGRLYDRTHKMKPFPPEPFRYLGGKVVRRAIGRKEAAERQGLTPSAIDKRLSALAPATIVDTSNENLHGKTTH